jgi:hypothetical protein
MEVHRTIIHQVLLMRFDEIPLSLLIQRSTLSRLTALFEFNEIEVAQSQAGKQIVNAQVGVFRNDVGDRPISKLVLEERRILLDLEGTSIDADKVISKLRQFLAEVASRSDTEFLQPIVKAEESEVVARLEFPAERLFAPELVRFIEDEFTHAASSDKARAVISPAQVLFLVQYKTADLQLDDYRIGLSRKEFILGPRPGLPLTEQIYASKAPVDTATHLRVLEELEKIFR